MLHLMRFLLQFGPIELVIQKRGPLCEKTENHRKFSSPNELHAEAIVSVSFSVDDIVPQMKE